VSYAALRKEGRRSTHLVVLDWEEYKTMTVLLEQWFLGVGGDVEVTDKSCSVDRGAATDMISRFGWLGVKAEVLERALWFGEGHHDGLIYVCGSVCYLDEMEWFGLVGVGVVLVGGMVLCALFGWRSAVFVSDAAGPCAVTVQCVQLSCATGRACRAVQTHSPSLQ
jgi:hypothetical protein